MMADDRSRWPRVKEIFHSALALTPHDRAEFLREACEDDVALRHDVESLLAAHAEAGNFAERPAIDALDPAESLRASTAAPALSPGFEFGQYRIVEPLGAGAMGEVYRACDMRLGRDVAVKVLPAGLSGDSGRVRRLEHEARLLAALNHPHVATIHGLEIAEGLRALVMELIEGPTLADRLSGGPVAVNEALELARQIAEALEAAHDKGIIHCDLKPANIKLTAVGTVKVLDFGLAMAIAPESRAPSVALADGRAATREGVIAGTPAYMSPEQARGEKADKRSDVWAFGCVLYEMLTAHPPFGRATLTETLAAVLEREPSWTTLPPAVPESIRRLLRRCLEKNPRRRVHDMGDARIEIEDALRDPHAVPAALAPTASPRRARVFATAAVILLVALVLTLSMLYMRAPATAPELRVDVATPVMPDPSAFAISPDGRQIVFAGEHSGQIRLWIRRLDQATAQPLPGTEGGRAPFWSPDGRLIGFFSGSELKRIEARGGATQSIANVVAGTAGTWGHDGTIVFSSTTTPSLQRVSAAGGPVETVTMPSAESTGHRYPRFLQGGPQFLFFSGGPDAVRGVYLGSIGSSQVRRLLPSDSQTSLLAPDWLVFVRQGTLLAQRFDLARRTLDGEPIVIADSVAFEPIAGAAAFSTSDVGVLAYRAGPSSMTRLEWFDRSGNVLGTMGSADQIELSNLRLSSDGRRVAAERTVRNDTDLWLLDSARQTRFTRGSAGRITRFPVWSPDRLRIAFAAIGSNSVRLSAKSSVVGDDAEVLFESAETKIPCDWSPDGQHLIYYVPDPKTGTDLWVLPLEGSRVPFVFLQTEANELWGQFSPDGRWLAYQSNETGRFEIYVRPFRQPGGQVAISTAGGVYPRWSRDGKELYYVAPDARMMAVPIRTTRTMLEAGVPAALFQTRKVGGGLNVISRSHQYDVAPDGRFLINIEAESRQTPITLLMNWKP
jgi:serine/threonine protein kinase/Tol biopolymer transport system component